MTRLDLEPLVRFLGYGPDAPDVVFLGHEEYCAAKAIPLNLRVRQGFPPRHDKNLACEELARACDAEGLRTEAASYRDAVEPGAVPTWRFHAQFVAGFLDRGLSWQDEYRLLGTREPRSCSFLTEWSPLPRPSWRHEHTELDVDTLIAEHQTLQREQLIAALAPGTVVVSVAGSPARLLGAMKRNGRRAWQQLDDAGDVAIARTDRFVALTVPFPRGREDAWSPWLARAVDAARRMRDDVLAG